MQSARPCFLPVAKSPATPSRPSAPEAGDPFRIAGAQSPPSGRSLNYLTSQGQNSASAGIGCRDWAVNPKIVSEFTDWRPSLQAKSYRQRHQDPSRTAILPSRYESRQSNGQHRSLVQRSVHRFQYPMVSGNPFFVHHEFHKDHALYPLPPRFARIVNIL